MRPDPPSPRHKSSRQRNAESPRRCVALDLLSLREYSSSVLSSLGPRKREGLTSKIAVAVMASMAARTKLRFEGADYSDARYRGEAGAANSKTFLSSSTAHAKPSLSEREESRAIGIARPSRTVADLVEGSIRNSIIA